MPLNPLCNVETFFYMGFFNSWPSLTLRMRWCDFCPLHETWQFAMAFEFILANFQSGPTYQARRGKSLETPPRCPIQNRSKMTSRAHVLTGCHENSDPVMLLNFRDFTIQFLPWKRAIIEHYYRSHISGIYTSARTSASRDHRILRAQTYSRHANESRKSKIITLFNSSTCVIY